MLGSLRRVGISLKAMARTPRSALRLVSAAASSASHSGMMHSGMLTPPDGAHHSSTIQSLFAFTQARPELLVLALVEGLAAEAGEGRERERAVGVVERRGP